MLANLSPVWLMVLGFICCLIFLFIFRKIYTFLSIFFKPFKKGKSYYCRVTAISDGDTLTCHRLNFRRSETKLRFAYVDAPESSQAYGKESARLIKSMVHQKWVRVKITDIDRYGRCVGV
ncbi:MAG: thermonuclease family protein, partial [Acinetobacter sp.]|nr:thermonuclease family protein [Acinetobacter sp.]